MRVRGETVGRGYNVSRNLMELSGNDLLNQEMKTMSLRGPTGRGNPFRCTVLMVRRRISDPDLRFNK